MRATVQGVGDFTEIPERDWQAPFLIVKTDQRTNKKNECWVHIANPAHMAKIQRETAWLLVQIAGKPFLVSSIGDPEQIEKQITSMLPKSMTTAA